MNPFQNFRLTRTVPLATSLIALAVLTLLTSPAPLSAQGTTGAITGTVYDNTSNEPLAGVVVSLHRPGGQPILVGAYTDTYGRYEIRNVPPGLYDLHTRLRTYSVTTISEVLVTVGLTTEQPIRLDKAPPIGRISGVVTDQHTGVPVAAANVFVLEPDGTPTKIGAFTNEQGEYVILNVPEGRYMLRSVMVGYKLMEVQRLLVQAGTTTLQNLQLQPAGTGIIRGTVTDHATGEPIAAVNIFVLEPDGTITNRGAFSNADGEYVIINVPEGRYLLRATMLHYKTMEVQELLVTAGETTTQHFQLEAVRTGSIAGTVTDEDTGEPIYQANVFLINPDGSRSTIGAFTNEKGEYTIINIPEGRYGVRVVYPDYHGMEVRDLLVTPGVRTEQSFQLKHR